MLDINESTFTLAYKEGDLDPQEIFAASPFTFSSPDVHRGESKVGEFVDKVDQQLQSS